jgi:ABC transporter transmembrane region
MVIDDFMNVIHLTARHYFPYLRSSQTLLRFLGLLTCLCSGAMTPIFSFLILRLLFKVSIGDTDVPTISKFGFIILSAAAANGLFLGLKYMIIETSGMLWVTRLRSKVFKLLTQDKKYFDHSANSHHALYQHFLMHPTISDAYCLLTHWLLVFPGHGVA